MSLEKLLRQLGIRPSRRLGQNFLVDRSVAAKIAALVPENASVLEVGGGLGALTASLIQKTAELTVVEMDKRLAQYLEAKYGKARVVCGDFLEMVLPETDYVVSSVPYSISRRFVLKLVRELGSWKKALLILQKEFVEKLLAKPCEHNYRAISVIVQSACRVEVLEEVPPHCFYPPPKVGSVLVGLTAKETFSRSDVLLVEKLVFRLFGQKNRTVGAALKAMGLAVPQNLADDPVLGLRVGCLDVEGVMKLAKAL